MLEQLSKDDKKWRNLALKICKDKTLADDLVNEMYIKLHNSKKTYDQINEWYVLITIRNLFYNHIKKRSKNVSIDAIFNIEEFLSEDNTTEDRKMINKALDELDFFEREILLHTRERSLRKNAEWLGCSIRFLTYNRDKGLENLKNTKTIKNYESKRTG